MPEKQPHDEPIPKRRALRESLYQQLSRFARDWCAGECQIDETQVTENALVAQLMRFLNARYDRLTYEFNTFRPEEFQSGRPGGPRTIDVVGYRRTTPKPSNASLVLEAKLMMNPDSVNAELILADVLRVASISKNITAKAERLVLVAGQQRCWEKLREQANRLLPSICPMDHVFSPLVAIATCGLATKWKKTTDLGDSWKKEHDQHVDDYLLSILPKRLRVELLGFAPSSRRVDERPERGIDVRVWRIKRR